MVTLTQAAGQEAVNTHQPVGAQPSGTEYNLGKLDARIEQLSAQKINDNEKGLTAVPVFLTSFVCIITFASLALAGIDAKTFGLLTAIAIIPWAISSFALIYYNTGDKLDGLIAAATKEREALLANTSQAV